MDARTTPPPRDAFIFLSGLGGGSHTIELGDVARRFSAALERNAATERASFSVEMGADLPHGDEGLSSRRVTIHRTEPDGDSRALIDLIELDYQGILKSTYGGRTPIRQAFSILGLLATTLPRFSRFWRRKSKTFGEKVQLGVAGLIFLLISLYLVMLIGTAVGTGAFAMASSPLGPDSPTPAAQILDAALAWLQPAVVLFTGFGLFWKDDVKRLVTDFGVEYASAIDYLGIDARKAVILGNFGALLEAVVEAEVEYRDIHVLAYSFGSIVAMDALFQRRDPPERFRRVKDVVTVGSPFDIVRAFWPDYYRDRRSRPGVGGRWLNVYSPDDVLSSNFRDDDADEPPDTGHGSGIPEVFEPDNLLFDWVAQGRRRPLLERLRRMAQLHMIYWGGGPGAQTFLDDAVRFLYGEDAVLS